MKTSEINNLKNNLIVEEPKTLMDLYKMVSNDEIAPITDEHDNIIGFNFHKNVTGIKYSKVINGQPTYGATEEERKKDEENLRNFIEKFENKFGQRLIQKTVDFSLQLIAADVVPDDLFYSAGSLYYIVLKDKKLYDEKGNVIVDCSDVKDELSNETLTRLIMAEFNA